MKKVALKLAQTAMLIVMVIAIFVSVKQLNTDTEACNGFPCINSYDCGSSCFCNYRSGSCYGTALMDN